MTTHDSSSRTGRRSLFRPVLVLLIIAVGFTAMMFLANSLRDVISVRRPAPPEVPADGPITLAFAGDTSLVPPVSVNGPSADIVNIVRRATLGFTNLELTIEEPRRAHDRPLPSGRGKAAASASADALRGLGFDVVSLANNHATDFGDEGLTGTMRAVESAGIVPVGAGRDLAAATKAVFVGHDPSRRIAFVAVAASAAAESFASPSQGDIRGRAGVSPLRYVANVTVDPATFDTLAASVVPMNAGPPPTDRELVMFGQKIVKGEQTSVSFTVDERDRASALAAIRAARTQAAIVVVSIHSHEPFNGGDAPADFVTAFAHDAIDAGAQVVVGHGPHRVRGMERYGNGVVFYSLGHFSFDPAVVDLRTPDPFDAGRNLYGVAMGAGAERVTTAAQLADERWWEGLVATARFDGEVLTDITVHPVALRHDLNGGSGGVPELAGQAEAEAILRRFSVLSKAGGGDLLFEAKGGVFHLPISQKR